MELGVITSLPTTASPSAKMVRRITGGTISRAAPPSRLIVFVPVTPTKPQWRGGFAIESAPARLALV